MEKTHDVHELPLVLVDTLAHDIEQRVTVDPEPKGLSKPQVRQLTPLRFLSPSPPN